MFGLYYVTTETGPSPSPTSTSSVLSGTSVNLLGGSQTGSIDPFGLASLSVHGVVGPGVTIGGGVGIQSDSGTEDAGTPTSSEITITTVAVSPRVGYILSATKSISVWFRGGITYSSMTFEQQSQCPPGAIICLGTVSSTISLVALSLDPMLVIAPIPHVAFLVGPAFDFGLSGNQATTVQGGSASSDRDRKASSYGVAAGLAVFL
jgi:hypothetical protein